MAPEPSDCRNELKNTPPKFFPQHFGCGQNFGPKNGNIWSEKPVEIGQKSSEVGACVGVWLEANQKGQGTYQKGIFLHF